VRSSRCTHVLWRKIPYFDLTAWTHLLWSLHAPFASLNFLWIFISLEGEFTIVNLLFMDLKIGKNFKLTAGIEPSSLFSPYYSVLSLYPLHDWGSWMKVINLIDIQIDRFRLRIFLDLLLVFIVYKLNLYTFIHGAQRCSG